MHDARVDVPDAELAVLKVLWERDRSTIREIAEILYPDGSTSGYATVQKLLERLESRGCVRHARDGRVNVYAASVGREELIRHRLRDAAEKLCEGSMTPLLTELVEARDLTRDELRSLRELVDRLDSKRGDR